MHIHTTYHIIFFIYFIIKSKDNNAKYQQILKKTELTVVHFQFLHVNVAGLNIPCFL